MGAQRVADVVVVGGGPAAHALARAAVAQGLDVTVIDPAPEAPWPASYGAWSDELPTDLPMNVIAARMPGTAVASDGVVHDLDREYVMLSTRAMQDHLTGHGARVVRGTVTGLADALGAGAGPTRFDQASAGAGRPTMTAVRLADDRMVAGHVVVDATGSRRVLTGGPARQPSAVQTAVGVIVDRPVNVQLAFMDWRADHGHDGWPTFLYAVPLEGGRILLEETSLARRPAMPLDVLHRRLLARLGNRGIIVPAAAPIEQVSITVDTPITVGSGPVIAFGAAAPLVHPATGYSLATSLTLAPAVAAAIADGLRASTGRLQDGAGGLRGAPAHAARQVIWTRQARAVHHLRRRGLEAVLALPHDRVGPFFDTFFGLPDHHRRAYLSCRDHPAAVMAAMAAMFAAADWDLRRHLVRWGAVGRAVASTIADGRTDNGWQDSPS